MRLDKRALRQRLVFLLVLLFVLVAVAVLSLVWIDNQVLKWLLFAGAVLSAIPVVFNVARLSAQVGEKTRHPDDGSAP